MGGSVGYGHLRHRRRAPPKREFSKLIIVCVAAAAAAVTVFACVLMWVTMDTTALAYLIPSVFAELATATGFYYYKARGENLLKLQKAGLKTEGMGLGGGYGGYGSRGGSYFNSSNNVSYGDYGEGDEL